MTTETNVTKRPIKLIVDTGSQISIIAEDTIREGVKIEPTTFNLIGITGSEHAIATLGDVKAQLTFGSEEVPDQLTMVERRYAGTHDGYLGYEFLKKHKAIIDMEKGEIRLKMDMERADEPTKEAAT